MARIDYDAVAPLYDSQPFRSKQADLHLGALVEERPVRRALDLGCGTGNQQAMNLAAYPGAKLHGADLFLGMLKQAAGKTRGVGWVQCDGSALPFRDAVFDYVSDQYSLHHVGDKRALIGEVARVLAPRGRFVIQNICPERMRDSLQYRSFPESRALDDRDFLPIEGHEAALREVGFCDVRSSVDHLRSKRRLGEYAVAVRRRDLNSSLQAISDDAYERGLAAIDGDVRRGADVVEDEVALLTVIATKR